MIFQLALAFAIGCAPAATLWPFLHPERLDYVLTNAGDADFPRSLVLLNLISLLVMGSLYALRWRRSDQRGLAGLVRITESTNAALLFLLAGPIITALRAPSIEAESPFFTLFLTLAAALAVCVSVGCWQRPRTVDRMTPTSGRADRSSWIAFGCVIAAILLYTACLSHFSILNAKHLRLPSFDLAIYHNLVWNTAHGNFLASSLVRGGTHMSAHFDPLLVLLAPIYRLVPRIETLLVFQSFWLASGAIPLFLLSRRVLASPWAAAVIALVFLLHPALHGINMYEFHSIAMVVPLLPWALYFVERQISWAYWLTLALILLTREDMSLVACGIGLYLVDNLRQRGKGIGTIGVSLLYLVAVKILVMGDASLLMTNSADSYSYRAHFAQMIPREDGGARDLLLTLFTNPIFALRVAFEERKVLFLLLLLVPMLALPLCAVRRRVLLLYGVMFCLLSSKHGPNSIYKQYTSMFLPFLLALLPYAVASVSTSARLGSLAADPARVRRALLAGVLAASLLVSWKFGVFIPNDSFRVGALWKPTHFEGPERHHDRDATYAFAAQALAQIPESASVSATRFLVAHAAGRADVRIYPRGRDADYLLVRPSTLREKGLAVFEALRIDPGFEELASQGGVVLLRRLPSTSEESGIGDSK